VKTGANDRGRSGMKKTITTASWDATLDTTSCNRYSNADLTITVRIGFKQINPPNGALAGTYHDYGDPNAPLRKIVKWGPGAWLHWRTQFVKSAASYWNGRFWLLNNFSEFKFSDRGVQYIPNIYCKFNLVGADAAMGNYHSVIDVVRLDKSETWFGSNAGLFDNLDTKPVQKGIDSRGRPIMQRAHVHEVGHLLGLGHVDVGKPNCPLGSNTNASACYGVTDVDKYSVMGEGMQLRNECAMPWRRAISQITGKGRAALVTDWSPSTIQQYPRSPAEVAANRYITSRPNRK